MPTFTWADVRERLRDRVEQKPFWNADEDRDAFNEALLLYNLCTGIWKRRLTLPTVANQYDYMLPASMLYRMRLTFNNLPMTPDSRPALNNLRPNWRAETTASGGDVPTRPMIWVPISLQLIYIWPADAVGGGTLTLDGVSETPVLVEDGDVVDTTEDVFSILLNFALHVLTFKKGGPAFAATLPYFQDFLKDAADTNDVIKTSQVYRRVMGVDRRDLKPMRDTGTLMDSLTQQG